MKQKGFISLLIAIIISVVAVTTIMTGVVLYKQGRLSPLVASITQVFEGTEDAEPEVKSEELQPEQEQDIINEEEQGSEEGEPESQTSLSEIEPELDPEVYTKVKGIISSDTTWAIENSPYIVTGNILVNEGVALTIKPGIKILFEKHPIAWNGYNIEVNGTLVAKGTENEKIIFTSVDKQIGGWGTIYFSDKSIDWNENTQTGSVIEHCIIEYGGSSQGGGTAVADTLIKIVDSAPLIKNNILRFSGHDALRIGKGIRIDLSQSSNEPKIINNKIQTGRILVMEGGSYFSGNEVTGQGFYIVGGFPIITKNNIINNNGDTYGGGIRIDSGSPKITYNNIVNNAHNGISILGGNPIVENNNIHNNKVFSILLTDTKNDFNFPSNWWGTTNTSVIGSLIYDFDDDYTLGKVNYQSIATSEIPDAGIQ